MSKRFYISTATRDMQAAVRVFRDEGDCASTVRAALRTAFQMGQENKHLRSTPKQVRDLERYVSSCGNRGPYR